MPAVAFSVTTGVPQTIAISPVIDPGNPQGVIGVQNDGANVLTIEGKILGSSAWAAVGTVAAATIGAVTFLPGLTSIRLSSTAATGLVIY